MMIGKVMRILARRKVLFGLVCVALVGSVVYADNRGYGFDLKYVALTGDLNEAQRAAIFQRLVVDRSRLKNIEDVKRDLERLSWVRRVDVTRLWPSRVTVAVFKESPIAWWNGDAFLDDAGNVFTSRYLSGSGLARLYGPPGAEREVMEQYQQLAKALGRSGLSIGTLMLDERGAWEFTTTSGIHVMLGKDDIMDRFQRFLQILGSPQLAARTNDIKRIDTRYSNGVAVSWKEVPTGLKVAKTDNY